ncbi:apolipoprotein N-acyltransferase [Nocardia sp. CNY236]|uniref:apolipoprotein N-acyltransferase n=1 Tax=Nocardia sp. CNY236 TaxID=1169152 RepID=UPI000686A383|nr:apolipoprotein N-acyltransferase [Nocardia sp. CNY236]
MLSAASEAVGRHPAWARLAAATLAGVLLFASFPPRSWWLLAPLGVGVLTLVVRGVGTLRAGFGYGFVAGAAFFVPLLPWTGIYVGPAPWLALSTACAVYVGVFGALARLVGTLPGWPLWVALAWSIAEWGRSSFPFGGFPWGRLAFGQADGWFLSLAALGGAPLVGFAVALTGTGAAALVSHMWSSRVFRDASGRGAASDDGGTFAKLFSHARFAAELPYITAVFACAVMPLAALLFRPIAFAPGDSHRTVTVAAIQGSVPRLGLDFNAQRRAVLDNHVRRTEQLAADVAAGRVPQPDVVIWPENSSDIDPLRNADAATAITAVAVRIGAPILVGAVLVDSDRTTTNTVIVWDPAAGPGERHDKKIIQPFGEYLPMRGFFRLFSEYADRAGYFVPGSGDGVVHAAGIDIGIATCYEVAFDRSFDDAVRAGAQVLAVPTNNATFGDSEMTYQQLAMSRLRAVEHGRALVVAATSGVSAIVAADGSVRQESVLLEPAALVAEIPVRNDNTIATRMGSAVQPLFAIIGGAAAVTAVFRRRARSNDCLATCDVVIDRPIVRRNQR